MAVKNLSVIIPAYNEEEGIGNVIDNIAKIFQANGVSFEIIVVDDGSSDNTAVVARSKNVTLIQSPCNLGYGASIKKGIQKSKFEFVSIIDADETYSSEDLLKLLEFSVIGFDMVVGVREKIYSSRLFFKHPARFMFRFLSEFVAGRKIPDINSGLRIFKKSALLNFLSNTCQGFSFTTSVTLIMLLESCSVKFVPIEYHKRKGKSKVNYFRDSLRAAQIIIRTILFYNPIKLFLLISLTVFLGFLISLAVYLIWKNQLVGLACVLSIFASLEIFCLGLLAEVFKK